MEYLTSSKHQSSPRTSFYRHLVASLLWNQVLGSWLNFIILIMSEVQIMAILINYTRIYFPPNYKDLISTFVLDFSLYISFDFSFNFLNHEAITILSRVFITAYMAIVVILTLYVSMTYLTIWRPNSLLLKLWACLGSFHHNIIFLFIHRYSVSLLRTLTEDTFVSDTGQSFFRLEMGIAITLMILNLIYGLFAARFAYYPIKDNASMACRSSIFSFSGLFFKFSMTTVTFLLVNRAGKWIKILLCLLFLAIRAIQYLTELPYYNPVFLKTFLTFTLVQVAQIVCITLWTFIAKGKAISNITVLYSQVFFGLLSCKIGYAYLRSTIWKYAQVENKSLRNMGDFFKKLLALDIVFKKGAIKNQVLEDKAQNEYELLFLQLISSHTSTCFKLDCVCKLVFINDAIENGTVKDMTKAFDVEKFYYHYIQTVYLEALEKMPSSPLLKLQLAHFYVDFDALTFPVAIRLINSIKEERQTNIEAVIKDKLLQKIEAKIKDTSFSDSYGLNIKLVIDYSIAKNNLRHKLASNVKLFKEFWEASSISKPIIKKLLDLNKLINTDAEQIEALWDTLSTTYPKLCYKDCIIYSLYMKIIRSSPFTAEKILTRYFSLHSLFLQSRGQTLNNADSMLGVNNIIICMSLNYEKCGTITYASYNVESLGYNTEDLIGKSIATLMPSFFAKRCQEFLQSHIMHKSTFSLFNQHLSIFIKLKNGQVRPATLITVPFPYLQNGLFCFGMIQISSKFEEYLLLQPNGIIDSSSEELSQNLNIRSNNLHSYNIREICADYDKITRYALFQRQGKREESLQPASSWRLVMPPILQSASNSMEAELIKHTLMTPKSLMSYPNIDTPKSSAALKIQKTFFPKKTQNYTSDDELEDIREFGEEFGTRGVNLKFFERSERRALRDERQYIRYRTFISCITYQNDDLYILRLQRNDDEVEREEGVKSVGLHHKEDFNITRPSRVIKEDSEEGQSIGEEKRTPHAKIAKVDRLFFPPALQVTEALSPDGLLSDRPMIKIWMEANTDGKQLSSTKHFDIEPGSYVQTNSPDLQKEQKRKLINRSSPNTGIDNTPSTQRLSKGMLSLAHMERAIHYNNSSSYKMVKGSIICLIFISAILFVYYQIEGTKNFAAIANNMEMLSLVMVRSVLDGRD